MLRHVMLVAVVLAGTRAWCAEASASKPVAALGAGGSWRVHYTFFPPRVSEAAAKELKIDPKDVAAVGRRRSGGRQLRGGYYATPLCYGLDTPPPPPDWREPGFDDAAWLRQVGPDCAGAASYSVPGPVARGKSGFVPEIGFIARRGRFVVKDRTKVTKLTLNVTYRGGFVAYLNGTEVARGSMPGGKVDHTTASSELYQLEAFLAKEKDGKLGKPLHHYAHRHKQYWPQWSLRERLAGPIAIKPGLLRNGLNVLAIQLHRADYPAVCTRQKVGLCFATLGLCELSLTAATPAVNIVSSVQRPKGFRVWNAEPWAGVADTSYDDPTEPLRPMRIVAARNGRFRGKVVVASDRATEGLTAKVSALKGPSDIPAKNVAVHYARPNPFWGGRYFSRSNLVGGTRFDMLVEQPPAKVEPVSPKVFNARFYIKRTQPAFCKELGLPGVPRLEAVIPVWLTVDVPKDAKPGVYKGTLTIRAKGIDPMPVPVEFDVADWALPDAKDRTSVLFLYQSPDTLAEYYKVPRWSEKHWALIERSLKLIGDAGNIGLHLPLLAKTQPGNVESMVAWIKKPDGTYDYDFTVFDRYLETALKYHPVEQLKVIVLYVWGYECGYPRDKRQRESLEYREKHTRGPLVTVLDPKTKQKSELRLPDYARPEAEKLLRPLLLAVKDRLAKKGLAGRIMLGMSSDPGVIPEHVGVLRNILPGVRWFRDAHPDGRSVPAVYKGKRSNVVVGCNAIVWSGAIPDPKSKRRYGWRHDPKGHMVLSFNRAGVGSLNLHGFASPWSLHMAMEATHALGRCGMGRIGADFFRAFGKHRSNTIDNRWPGAQIGGALAIRHGTSDLLAPQPDGAVPTVRLWNLLLGVQEAEARVFIEKALLAKTLPGGLAKRCQDLLDERTDAIRMWPIYSGAGSAGWHDKTRRLFALAAELSKGRPRNE